jgi:ParB family chromosome partitioning protein
MAAKRSDVLAERAERTKLVQKIVKDLKALGENVSMKEVATNIDMYQQLLVSRANGESTETLSSDAKAALKSMNEYYELLVSGQDDVYIDETFKRISVIGGKVVEFVLAIVPYHLIETKTKVVEENKRNQSALNEFTLSYILRTLRDDGQQEEAEGFMPEGESVIYVMDGSSRRWSCVLAKKPFKIWVARETIDSTDVAYRSEVANDHKSLSFYESCSDVVSAKRNGLSNIQIANKLGWSEGRVSIALGARTELPEAIYDCFQAKTSVSRETIEKLVPMWRALVKQKQDGEFVAQLCPFESSECENDEQVLAYLLMTGKSLIPTAKADNTLKGYSQRSNCLVKHKFNRQKGELTINVKEATPEILEKIEKFLEEL